jgi:integrase
VPKNNSISPALADKPNKPSAEFPLFAHATRRWAKKIKGKIVYFGPWSDPDAALKNYFDFVDGKPMGKTLRPQSVPSERPNKPYPEFPLFPHATRRWAKKIKGRLVYFGPWSDPDGALKNYLDQADALHAGRKPRVESEGASIKDVCNNFLNIKKARLDSGELSSHSWTKYKKVADEVIAAFGKQRLASDLDGQDFARLRERMASKWGVNRLADMIQHVRSVFKAAFESGLLAVPTRFGPGFARPTKKSIRLHRAKLGAKLFSAEEIRRLLDTAGVPMKAMILLGVNCGFGNSDCGNLPLAAADLETGWIDFPRPKTGVSRRCSLWPETVEALKAALGKRPEPKIAEDAGLFFITKRGQRWGNGTTTAPVSQEMEKLLHALGIYRKGLGFYVLRHTFRTVADGSKDQPATDAIMGHESSHMSSVYREAIADGRLQAVSEYVRRWLFGDGDRVE